jgi:hypothetical protein
LSLLVVVEFALDPIDGAAEEIDGRPEQVLEVSRGSLKAWSALDSD